MRKEITRDSRELFVTILAYLDPNKPVPEYEYDTTQPEREINQFYAGEILELLPKDIEPTSAESKGHSELNQNREKIKNLCHLLTTAQDVTYGRKFYSKDEVVTFYLFSIQQLLKKNHETKYRFIDSHYNKPIEKITKRQIQMPSDQTKKDIIKPFVEKISNNDFDLHNRKNIEAVKEDLKNIGASDLIKKITDLITLFNNADMDNNLNGKEKKVIKDEIILSLADIVANNITPFFTGDKPLGADNLLPILTAVFLATDISEEILNKVKIHIEGSELASGGEKTAYLLCQIYHVIDCLLNPRVTKSTKESTTKTPSSKSSSSLFSTPTASNLTKFANAEKAEKKSFSIKLYNFFIGLFSSGSSERIQSDGEKEALSQFGP